MKPSTANTWNRWKGQARKPTGLPTESWWIGMSREEFNELVKRETPRMSQATEANWVSQMLVGGRP